MTIPNQRNPVCIYPKTLLRVCMVFQLRNHIGPQSLLPLASTAPSLLTSSTSSSTLYFLSQSCLLYPTLGPCNHIRQFLCHCDLSIDLSEASALSGLQCSPFSHKPLCRTSPLRILRTTTRRLRLDRSLAHSMGQLQRSCLLP